METGKNKYLAWKMNIDTYLKIVERAKEMGIKSGESMQAAFEEVLKEEQEKIELLGETDRDVDLLTGDMREEGLKVFNIKELERKEKNNE